MSLTRRSVTAAFALGGVLLASCSGSDDDLAEPPTTSSTVAEAVVTSVAPTSAAGQATTSNTTEATTASTTSTEPPPVTVVDLAEEGTPGLDSDDDFCAAWSRFAGSFQVVAVTAAFGSGSEADLAALEIAAAPTVVEAYDSMFDNWPDELDEERELVADRFLGPFARRSQAAADTLDEVGVNAETQQEIHDAWIAGLARRDPTNPEFAIDLADDAWVTIDEAASIFVTRLVPFPSDPSLVTNVSTPLTDAYLAVSCPDQGTLSGQEVQTP